MFYALCAALRQMEILRRFGERVIFAVPKVKTVLNIDVSASAILSFFVECGM